MSQDKLLDVAIREFGLKGLDGASTRGIAGAAGTAMSAITYHYGSKEALYLAAADHIAANMADEIGPTIELCDPPERCDADAARAGIHAVIDRLVQKMASESSADVALFILREQMRPSEAFDRIYDGAMARVITHLVALIAIVTDRDVAAARTIAMTVMGQVLAIRAARASILRTFDIGHLDFTHIDALRQQIHVNIDAILDRMAAGEPQ